MRPAPPAACAYQPSRPRNATDATGAGAGTATRWLGPIGCAPHSRVASISAASLSTFSERWRTVFASLVLTSFKVNKRTPPTLPIDPVASQLAPSAPLISARHEALSSQPT